MKKKVKVGFFSLTCCEGCTISFIEILNKKFFDYAEKMDFVYLRALKKENKMIPMDIAFVEGAVSSPEEVERLKEIRNNAKKLVALGSAAINGWPSNLRNKFDSVKKERVKKIVEKTGQLEKVSPLKDYVKVDDGIPGCPIEEDIFIKKVDGYLNA